MKTIVQLLCLVTGFKQVSGLSNLSLLKHRQDDTFQLWVGKAIARSAARRVESKMQTQVEDIRHRSGQHLNSSFLGKVTGPDYERNVPSKTNPLGSGTNIAALTHGVIISGARIWDDKVTGVHLALVGLTIMIKPAQADGGKARQEDTKTRGKKETGEQEGKWIQKLAIVAITVRSIRTGRSSWVAALLCLKICTSQFVGNGNPWKNLRPSVGQVKVEETALKGERRELEPPTENKISKEKQEDSSSEIKVATMAQALIQDTVTQNSLLYASHLPDQTQTNHILKAAEAKSSLENINPLLQNATFVTRCATTFDRATDPENQTGCIKISGIFSVQNMLLYSSMTWVPGSVAGMESEVHHGPLYSQSMFELTVCDHKFLLNLTSNQDKQGVWRELGESFRGNLQTQQSCGVRNIMLLGGAAYAISVTIIVVTMFLLWSKEKCLNQRQKETKEKEKRREKQKDNSSPYMKMDRPTPRKQLESLKRKSVKGIDLGLGLCDHTSMGDYAVPRRILRRLSISKDRPGRPRSRRGGATASTLPLTYLRAPSPGPLPLQQSQGGCVLCPFLGSPGPPDAASSSRAPAREGESLSPMSSQLQGMDTILATMGPGKPPTPPPPQSAQNPPGRRPGTQQHRRLPSTFALTLIAICIAAGPSQAQVQHKTGWVVAILGSTPVQTDLVETLKQSWNKVTQNLGDMTSPEDKKEEDLEKENTAYETLRILAGTRVQLTCSHQEIFAGSISWSNQRSNNNPMGAMPEGLQFEGNTISFIAPAEPTVISCLIRRGNLEFLQQFSLQVVESLEDETDTMPTQVEAYSCVTGHTNELATISSSHIQECHEDHYKSYQEEEVKKKTILARKRIHKILVPRCFAKIKIYGAHCCKYGKLSMWSLVVDDVLPLNAKICRRLHEEGKADIRVGDDVVQISNASVSTSPIQKSMRLAGSEIRTDGKCLPALDFPQLIPRHLDLIKRIFRSKSHKDASFFAGQLKILLDEETGYIDYERQSISIPRIGQSEKFATVGQQLNGSTLEFGTYVTDVTEEKFDGFRMIESNVEARQFTDMTNQNHPHILVVQTAAMKMALQLIANITVLGNISCQSTHLNAIYICDHINQDLGMDLDTTVMAQLGSQTHLFAQMNIQQSISKLLLFICQNRRLMFSYALRSPGIEALPFSIPRGVITISRGESIRILACSLVTAFPTKQVLTNCHNELPVTVATKDGSRPMFLEAGSRVLVDSGSPVMCSRSFPVKFLVDENRSICQYPTPSKLEICKTDTVLDPGEGLDEARMKTLAQEESASPQAGDEISRIIISFLTASMYRKSLAHTLAFNQQECSDSFFCQTAYMHSSALRMELSRQNMSLFDHLFSTHVWGILELVTTFWATYAITAGTVSWLLRVRFTCNKKNANLTFCQWILNVATQLDRHLNPLGVSRIVFVRFMDSATAVQNHLEETMGRILTNLSQLIQRVADLEDRLRESSDQGIYDTVRRKKCTAGRSRTSKGVHQAPRWSTKGTTKRKMLVPRIKKGFAPQPQNTNYSLKQFPPGPKPPPRRTKKVTGSFPSTHPVDVSMESEYHDAQINEPGETGRLLTVDLHYHHKSDDLGQSEEGEHAPAEGDAFDRQVLRREEHRMQTENKRNRESRWSQLKNRYLHLLSPEGVDDSDNEGM